VSQVSKIQICADSRYQCSLGVAEEITSIAREYMTRRSMTRSKL
jgi:hypothetical protein